MKKLLVVAVAASLLLSTAVKAENTNSVGKGNWLVGAAMDVNHVWGGGMDGRTTFALQSEVGYFVYDFLMPEAKVNFMVSDGFDSELITGGARLYWNKGKPYLPFVRLNLGFGSVKEGTRANAFALNPGIGIDYLLTKNVAIGAQANYTAYIRSSTFNSFDFPISFSIYF